MKSPNEIKNGLRHCRRMSMCDSKCNYYFETACNSKLITDAKAYIDQLEEQIMLMKIQMHGDCGVCKHRGGFDLKGQTMSQRCYECMAKESRPNWEYEGLPEVKSR